MSVRCTPSTIQWLPKATKRSSSTSNVWRESPSGKRVEFRRVLAEERRAAMDGVDLAFMSEHHPAPHLAAAALVRVLEDRRQPFSGFFL